LSLLGNVKGKAVLAQACGTGTVSKCFSRQGADVTGIDIAESVPPEIQEIEERERLGIKYLACSASRFKDLLDFLHSNDVFIM